MHGPLRWAGGKGGAIPRRGDLASQRSHGGPVSTCLPGEPGPFRTGTARTFPNVQHVQETKPDDQRQISLRPSLRLG